MPTIVDEEFGSISLRRHTKASSVRIRMAPDGTLRVSMPLYTPIFLAKRFINSSRTQLRELVESHQQSSLQLHDGMQIGKSHRLVVQATEGKTVSNRKVQRITVHLNSRQSLHDPAVVAIVRKSIIEAHRIEAKSYLPKRLQFLAEKYGFEFHRLRFSHASGRWGSCSTSGTISLNIALMKLPFELIDYVLIHELSHTKQMNHSPKFWQLVAQHDPDYKEHRKRLKQESPII